MAAVDDPTTAGKIYEAYGYEFKNQSRIIVLKIKVYSIQLWNN